MPRTFPKSHLAQFNLKYLQVKKNLVLSSKTDNTITITILNPPQPPSPFSFSKEEATARESTEEGKEDGGEEIQKLKEHDFSWKNNLYF